MFIKDVNIYSSNLPEVSREAVNDFIENKETLIRLVDDKLVSREDIEELIGNNHLDEIFEYHKYHYRLMAQFFKTNDFKLLFNLIPRIYKNYKQVDFSYDYFKEDLKTWIPVIDKFLKPDNVLSINEVYSRMLEKHQNFVALSQKIK